MKLEERIIAFSELGKVIAETISGETNRFSSRLNDLILSQEKENAWFTPENVRMALKALGDELTFTNLKNWTERYPGLGTDRNPVNVGVVMAGNIPLVGFHDFLSVLISGNRIIAKTSSKDRSLMPEIAGILCEIDADFSESIVFTDQALKGIDMIIATGSDNSSRYFEFYFGKYPHIIRKNRNSVAVIKGNETDDDLENLGTDIFSYFGFGCRNVSKVFIPQGYDINKMVKYWQTFSGIINHHKYANNYDFNKAVWMINKEKFTDAGFLHLKESKELSSPVSVLYYEFYKNEENLHQNLEFLKDKIQCIGGRDYAGFGKCQTPKLWDYSDNIDTLDFLLKKNMPGIL